MTAIFYAVVGLLFGVLAERTTYCIVVATHQVMGVKYSRIYEMILVGIAGSGKSTLTAQLSSAMESQGPPWSRLTSTRPPTSPL